MIPSLKKKNRYQNGPDNGLFMFAFLTETLSHHQAALCSGLIMTSIIMMEIMSRLVAIFFPVVTECSSISCSYVKRLVFFVNIKSILIQAQVIPSPYGVGSREAKQAIKRICNLQGGKGHISVTSSNAPIPAEYLLCLMIFHVYKLFQIHLALARHLD
jgi:hypothetical protein